MDSFSIKDRVPILKKYFFFSIILISFSPFIIYSQTSVLDFKHFSVDQGMSSSDLGAIYQDRTGYLWFGSYNGLDRYDGYNFTSYKYPGDSVRFINYFPGTISEDDEGNIWIGSYSGGLEKIDPKTKSLKHYVPNPMQAETEWSNIVFAIYTDKNNVMWIGTGNGFYKYNRSNETFTFFRYDENDPHSLGHNAVNAIYEDRSGTLWLATGGGLDRFDRETNKFFHYWHYPNNKWGNTKTAMYWVLSIIEDYDGVLWLGTDGGLVEFDKKAETFSRYSHDPQNSIGQAHNVIKSLCEDGSGRLWLATQAGLDVFNKRTKIFTYYIHDEKKSGSLSSDKIVSVFIDRSGSLWISTSEGLNKVDCTIPLFKKYTYDPLQTGNLSSDRVYYLLENNKEMIWILTAKGLETFDPKNEKFITIPYRIKINMVFLDNFGNLLVCPNSGGLYKLDQNNLWTCYIDSSSGNNPEYPSSLYPADRDRFWIGTGNGDLYLFNPLTFQKKWIINIKKPSITIYEDSYGLVWFGGIATGLFCYDPYKDTISQFNSDPKNPLTISDNTIFSFCEDQSKTLWFGTNNGLDRYNRSNNNFTRITQKDGFLSYGIAQILEDDDGNLWMSARHGITKFNPSTFQFKNYYASAEFRGIKFSDLKVGCCTKKGEMYFGGENGFIRFHPDSIKDNPFIPPVVITSFRKFEKPFPFGKEVELPHTDNFISFEFAALSYVNNEQNQYAYMMEGLDNDWIYCGTRRYASYPNMEPGEYFFRVKGSTSNRIWNEAGTSLKIIILPPWWRTTWAYIFYVLFIASIIYSTWKVQLKRLRVKHEFEMSRFEAQKLHEVDEIKSRFFTNISHEFRTPLTLILGPVKQIIERIKDEKTKDELSIVHKNANKLLGLVNQLLDISKLESGKMKLQTIPQNIIPYLKVLVMSFTSYAERKRITLKFNSSEDEIIVFIDKDKIEKIITNILSNAFKFTPEGGRIEINVNADDKYVNVSVCDNGIGIPKEKMEKIFDRFYQVDGGHTREQEGTGIGLSLTKELVELHKGKIEVESEEGKGTTLTISIPLGKEHLKPEEIFEKDNEQEYVKEKIKPEYEDGIERKVKHKIDIDMFEKDTLPLLLIVEDNADVRNYIKDNLKKDFRVLEAIDGEDGWNKSVESAGGGPDLIVSDVMMPKMDGFELCNKLKTDERTSHIPVILLTAKASSTDKIEGFETGADEYIMKPFEPAELRARIKNLIEQRKRIHQHFQKNGILELNQTKITSIDKKFLQRAFDIIAQNISDSSFSIEIFAEKLYVSKSLLRKKIVSLTGEPPVELIKIIRLKKAAELIEKNFGNLSEIALEVGFNNPAYFSECFKKQFGVSPSQYHPQNTNS
jgi:signal transduction histidine kinase/ligand-binding sensor domain-containing protein/DNA-binding NarL/FixJ family response regulator